MVSLKLNDLAAEKHFLNVEPQLIKRIEGILKSKHITKNKKRISINADGEKILGLLKAKTDLLKLIVTARPDRMEKIIGFFRHRFPNAFNTRTVTNKILYNLFVSNCYENKVFEKHAFITLINIHSCLYCNRNYIYSLDKGDRIKPEIDHFYPKSSYPFLAISFYNLLPCCETCNGLNAKGNTDPVVAKLISPYELHGDSFRFSYDVGNIEILNPLADPSCIDVKFQVKVAGNDKTFKLEKLYNKHKDHVLELIIKSKLKYAEKYREYLREYKDFQFSDHEINRMILGNYSKTEEIHLRPLAKLYQDIGKELGLIGD